MPLLAPELDDLPEHMEGLFGFLNLPKVITDAQHSRQYLLPLRERYYILLFVHPTPGIAKILSQEDAAVGEVSHNFQ